MRKLLTRISKLSEINLPLSTFTCAVSSTCAVLDISEETQCYTSIRKMLSRSRDTGRPLSEDVDDVCGYCREDQRYVGEIDIGSNLLCQKLVPLLSVLTSLQVSARNEIPAEHWG